MLVLNRSEESKARPLEAHKTQSVALVDAEIDKVRRMFVTPITGQELTYQEKERQAKAYVALSTEPDPQSPAALDQFGFILAEVGLTGETPWQVAQVILSKAAAMRHVGPAIERGRMVARDQIAKAESELEIELVLSQFKAALVELSKSV